MRIAVVALLLCGCDVLFPLNGPSGDASPPPDDGPSTDGIEHDDARTTACDVTTCPAIYGNIPGTPVSRYLKVTDPTRSFAAAQQACIETRGSSTAFTHLVVLEDQAELDHIRGTIDDTLPAWIGHRRSGIAFVPVTEQTVDYPPSMGGPWGTNQPDPSFDCVAIEVEAETIGTFACDVPHQYVCECDCFAPEPL